MAQFDVQSIDRQSGDESWTVVTAATADEARTLVADAGMLTGVVRLKSVHDPMPVEEKSAGVAPMTTAGERRGLRWVVLIGIAVIVAVGVVKLVTSLNQAKIDRINEDTDRFKRRQEFNEKITGSGR